MVDDERAALAVIKRQLEELGYRVQSAPGAVEALAAAGRSDAAIDLLVSDVVMPDQSGPELAKALLAIHPNIRILFISGYPGDALKSPLLDPTRNLLSKPFKSESLARKIREILDA